MSGGAGGRAGRARRLIVTADDYGAGPVIDRGIRIAADCGVLTAVGALANYPGAAESLIRLRHAQPHLGIGVHLNITSGPPLSSPAGLEPICRDGAFLGLPRLFERLDFLDLAAVERELRAQIGVLQRISIPIDHLSSHHNALAIYPPLLDLMTSLAAELEVPIRTPVAVSQTHTRRYGYAYTRQKGADTVVHLLERRPLQSLTVVPMTWFRLMASKRILRRRRIPHPDHLIDALFGSPTEENLRHIVEKLPPGTAELVVHLADWRAGEDIPVGIEVDQFPNRTRELELITSAWFAELLRDRGVRSASYASLQSNPA